MFSGNRLNDFLFSYIFELRENYSKKMKIWPLEKQLHTSDVRWEYQEIESLLSNILSLRIFYESLIPVTQDLKVS